ncbi:NAD kinase-like isoform X2 [Penaeus indicus]|uniref:NAD kinase-like isoform X2 n=1 Tax=Penaeus indicus TaxID=29960 RepID=UPI00300D4316
MGGHCSKAPHAGRENWLLSTPPSRAPGDPRLKTPTAPGALRTANLLHRVRVAPCDLAQMRVTEGPAGVALHPVCACGKFQGWCGPSARRGGGDVEPDSLEPDGEEPRQCTHAAAAAASCCCCLLPAPAPCEPSPCHAARPAVPRVTLVNGLDRRRECAREARRKARAEYDRMRKGLKAEVSRARDGGRVLPLQQELPCASCAARRPHTAPAEATRTERRLRCVSASLEAPRCQAANPLAEPVPEAALRSRSFWWDSYFSSFLRTIQDPASQRLTWYKPPLSVLVIKKVRDAQVIQPFIQLVKWLTIEKRMLVFVEASVMEESLVTSHSGFPVLKDKLMSFREGQDDLTDKIDFIICLGGDGTLLYASSLFQQSVPPVMAFHLGSLGFLTPFKFDNFQDQVTNVLEGHAALTLRSRLRCIILRKDQETGKGGCPPTNLLVLNEVVIDRGPSPYLSNIDLYLDGKRITSVQGDGLIVSTPTGSTAYAVAAGASMIHPSVPAIMVTPICPHSLSFRPIVVPAGVELKIKLNYEARNTCWASFDGRHQQELMVGDSLRVTTSIYPVPSICAEDQIADWFASLDECLRWNDRKRQKHFDDPDDLSPPDLTPDLTHSSSSDTLDSLSERNEGFDN